MAGRRQWIVLGAFVVLLALLYFANRSQVAGLSGVSADDGKFTPLNVQEPTLRLDELRNLQKLQYGGAHRNIFTSTPPPVQSTAAQLEKEKPPEHRYPTVPLPPPVVVPGELFGFATMAQSGRRVAFFKEGDDVLVVAEGDTFLNRFRIVRVSNDSAEVEQLADGRHATVPMVQPPVGDQGSSQ